MLRILMVLFLIVGLSGCASTHKNKKMTAAEMEAKIAELEGRVSSQQEEITSLRSDLAGAKMDAQEAKSVASSKMDSRTPVKVSPTKIQQALKNAGYYSGAIDGKIGKKTTEAIKKFQEANGLKVDGVVGSKTWNALSQYL